MFALFLLIGPARCSPRWYYDGEAVQIIVPCALLGVRYASRSETYALPTAVSNADPRPIPRAVYYATPAFAVPAAGVLQIGSVYIGFVMDGIYAVWLRRFVNVGFATLELRILLTVSAATTIIFTHFQLVSENYRWWWRAFLTGGSCAP